MDGSNVLELPSQISTASAVVTASNTMLPADEVRDKSLSGCCFAFTKSHHFHVYASNDLWPKQMLGSYTMCLLGPYPYTNTGAIRGEVLANPLLHRVPHC